MKRTAYDYAIKCVLLGKSGVGITSVLKRLVEDTFGPLQCVDIKKCRIHYIELPNVVVKMFLWDNPADAYKTTSDDICSYLLFYEVTDRSSFEFIKNKISSIRAARPNSIICLVGNKIDLEGEREIDSEEVNEFALKYGCKHAEVSAAIGKNILDLFHIAAEIVLLKIQETNVPLTLESLPEPPPCVKEITSPITTQKDNSIFNLDEHHLLIYKSINDNNVERFNVLFDELILENKNVFYLRSLLENLTSICERQKRSEFKKPLLLAYSKIRAGDGRDLFWKAKLLSKFSFLFSAENFQKDSKIRAADEVIKLMEDNNLTRENLPEAAKQGLLKKICRI